MPRNECPTPVECERRAVPWHCADATASAPERSSDELVQAIAAWLDTVVARYDAQEQITPSTITVFHAQSTPDISVYDYILRINKYGNFSKSVLVAALVYIDRVLEDNPEIVMTSRTIHRLLITSVLVSAKFNDDIHLGNGAFAQIGGIRNAELNRLEVNFLKLCRFTLVVSEELYYTTISAFDAHVEGSSPSNVMSIFAMPEMCGLGSPLGKASSRRKAHEVADEVFRDTYRGDLVAVS